jgi:hypothetical protein
VLQRQIITVDVNSVRETVGDGSGSGSGNGSVAALRAVPTDCVSCTVQTGTEQIQLQSEKLKQTQFNIYICVFNLMSLEFCYFI